MRYIISVIVASFLLVSCSNERLANPSQYVNPFIGASTSTGLAGTYHGMGKPFREQHSLRHGSGKSSNHHWWR